MTGFDHEHSVAIEEAARFIVATPHHQRRKSAYPLLREQFGLTALEAVSAIREADRMRQGARHGGS